MAAANDPGPEASAEDPRMELEDVLAEANLEWVRERNKDALERLGDPREAPEYAATLAALDSKDKIPHGVWRGGFVWNFWQDADNPQGLWRRATWESYTSAGQADKVEWEVVLDLDKLSKAEGKTFVWKGARVLDEGPGGPKPRQAKHAILLLSDGGSDATEAREFDISTKAFVPVAEGGFRLPPSKSRVSWYDSNTLLVGTDATGDGAPEDAKEPWTTSGYPRTVRVWKRGTPLQASTLQYEGEVTDVAVSGYSYFDCHGSGASRFYEFHHRSMTFYTSKTQVRWPPAASPDGPKGTWKDVPIPDDASVSAFADQALVTLRSEWADAPGADGPFRAGALIACCFNDLIEGNDALSWTVLFEPTERTSLEGFTATKNRLAVSYMDNVLTRLQLWSYDSGGGSASSPWEKFGPAVGLGTDSFSVSALDGDESDAVWVTRSGYLTPSTLYVEEESVDVLIDPSAPLDGDAPTLSLPKRGALYQLPSFFDTANLVATQRSATSADGTVVPYFLVASRETLARAESGDIANQPPCLVYGYGGFEIPLGSGYSAGIGLGWLERGGTYVEACIRGGGEFGPRWHQAALKENRIKAYEDFRAVCEAVSAEKLARKDGVGIQGGSNGGLLVGNMLTTFPESFHAAVCQVPLLDMRRFDRLLAGASWVAEYGKPDEDFDRFLNRYSPYHQLGHRPCVSDAGKVPAALFTTSTRDDRVHPAHARKMVKKLLDMGSFTTYYYENIEGGHGGAANNEQRAFMKTLEYEFLWSTLGGGGARASAAKL